VRFPFTAFALLPELITNDQHQLDEVLTAVDGSVRDDHCRGVARLTGFPGGCIPSLVLWRAEIGLGDVAGV
jgi:hypothetical protein